jgi:TctA family transporter
MHIENYIADSFCLILCSMYFILFCLCLVCMVSLTKQKVIRCMQWFFFHLMLNA